MMIIRTLLIVATVASLLVLVWYAGFYRAAQQREAFLSEHVVPSVPQPPIDLSPERYADVPDPVKRYFEYAFNGQTSVQVNWVEWQERGDFLLPVGRFKSRGRQAGHPLKPLYAWSGSFWKFGLPLLESRDAFFVDGHDMRAKLFGWVTVMQTDYEAEEDISSLYSYLTLRYYGQAPAMPWTFLPNEYVAWQPVDDRSARLVITHADLEGSYLVTFASDGRIERMEIDQFLMEGNHVMQREVGLKLDYELVNGFRIPTRMDYRWYLEDGTLSSHYQFSIRDVVYHAN